MNEKQKAMKQIQLFFGAIILIISITGVIILNFGEVGEVNRLAHEFIQLIHQGRYLDAYQYVDSSEITLEDLKKVSALAAHYYVDVTYFYQSNSDENIYIAGFKTDLDDIDKVNDDDLAFYIKKIKGKWKVTFISHYST